jgi:hypothetical protein
LIRFENLKVENWDTAIRGMRNSWESWDKSDSHYEEFAESGEWWQEYVVGPEDLKLMRKLVKAGQDHAKFVRMINVSVDIIAPEYWWKEYDTYKVGTVANSTSMMHTFGKDFISQEAFNFEDVDYDLQIIYMELISEAHRRWVLSGKKKPSREWRQMLQLSAQSYIYTRTCTLNYGVLANMYHSRRSHRLQEWRDMAEWIKTLPYSELITKEGL